MRNPTRWRNLEVALVAAGLIAIPATFLVPGAADGSALGFVLLGGGVLAVIFGAMWAWSRHAEARVESALRRGDGVIARWRVEAATWTAFVAFNRTVGVNAMPVRAVVAASGAEIVVGATAVMVDGVVRTLCASGRVDGHMRFWGGDWIVERAGVVDGPPRCIGLYLRARNARGAGVHANLVFPTSDDAPAEAEAALAHLRSRAADHAAAST